MVSIFSCTCYLLLSSVLTQDEEKLHLRKKRPISRSFLREQKPLDIHTATQRPQTEAFLSFLTATQSKPETSTTIKREFFCTHPNGKNINNVIHNVHKDSHSNILHHYSRKRIGDGNQNKCPGFGLNLNSASVFVLKILKFGSEELTCLTLLFKLTNQSASLQTSYG